MSTWTKQKGYPVINAKLKGNNMELDQVVSYVKYYPSHLSCIYREENGLVYVCFS
jgi:hypothetical protein